MSKWKYNFSQEVADELEPLMSKASSVGELRRIQAVYYRARFGDDAKTVAIRTGLDLGTIYNLHSEWLRSGKAALELAPRGGRRNEYMTFEEEKKWLFDTFGESAIAGGMLEVSAITRAYEKKLGRSVYSSTVYDLLHRHGWRKIAPRPRHPKADIEAQDSFKKTGKTRLKKRIKPQKTQVSR